MSATSFGNTHLCIHVFITQYMTRWCPATQQGNEQGAKAERQPFSSSSSAYNTGNMQTRCCHAFHVRDSGYASEPASVTIIPSYVISNTLPAP